MADNKPLSTGWIMGVAGAIILLLCSIVGATVSSWARTIEQRGLENQTRITVLEKQYAAITERQQVMIDLLREHMARDRR